MAYTFICKVCGSEYELSYEELESGPLYLLENCSHACHRVCSSEKMVNHGDCAMSGCCL